MTRLKTNDFDQIQLYTLKNRSGMQVSLTHFGATVVSILCPDRHGALADIVLGYSSLEGYLNAPARAYFGATVGRVANRIRGAEFSLEGKKHRLGKNQNNDSLHGGHFGFDRMAWDARVVKSRNATGIKFSRLSLDGEEGYPGNLKVQVTYSLSEDNALSFEAQASTDKATPVNICNHNYYNLAGEGQGNILSHRLWINADRYTPVDKGLIPTGIIASVAGTPFEFRRAKAIGHDIAGPQAQLAYAGGYDHNFVLNKSGLQDSLSLAATLSEAKSGRHLEFWTQEPGLQFYSGNFIDGRLKGKSGKIYGKHSGLCLETQHFPDSPNQPQFPSVILQPGKTYRTKTIIRFSAK